MPQTATLTPYDLSEAEKIGKRLYRKQVLKKGTILYKGQRIKFDDAFLTDLASSFKNGAYDQVPFVLADTDNRHNEDPERFRGEITGFEVTKDGLDALVAVNKQGAKILEDNPKLGVSARIVQGLQKADGRTFKRAIRHVLGTMDPRVTGLRPWQAVDLSEEDDTEVVDLTAEIYEEDGHMAKRKQGKAVADDSATDDGLDLDLSSMSDAEFLEFLDLGETTTTEDDSTVDDDTEDDNPDDRSVEEVETDTDEETEDDGSGVTDIDPNSVDAGGDEDEDDEDDDTDLSDAVLDTEGRDEITQMRIDLAEERFKAERKDLLRAGVPKHLVDLAAPILSSPDATMLDLSNADEPVNATEIVRGVLEGVKGMIDLRPEIGHPVDLSTSEEDGETALLKQWEQEYGTA